jgi:hypothetical protein
VKLRGTLPLATFAALLAACTSGSVPPTVDTTTGSPPILVAAPRTCPLPMERGNTVPANQIVDAMDGHVPQWLPTGFGLAGGWTDGHGTWATWTDGDCREVTVSSDHGGPAEGASGPQVGSWVVTADAPGQCANAVLGSATCLDYQAPAPLGSVGVQAMGLERPEGDRVVQSIPL